MQQADLDGSQLGELAQHLARHDVKAARPRLEQDLALDPHHRSAGTARHPHVDPGAAERHALGLEQRPLARALGERAVGAHDPVPRDRRIGAVVEHRARDPWRPRRDIPVRAHEPRRHRADSPRISLVAVLGAHGDAA